MTQTVQEVYENSGLSKEEKRDITMNVKYMESFPPIFGKNPKIRVAVARIKEYKYRKAGGKIESA